jgi:M3 family oligoendopeptidase
MRIMPPLHFRDIDVPAPTYEATTAEHLEIQQEFDRAADAGAALAAVKRWDELRRRLETWQSLTHLRFHQDTRNEAYKKARDYCDELRPKLVDLDVRMKRKLVQSPLRSDLQRKLGAQAFALWEADITTYDPVIEQEMVREAKLEADYVELTASAKLEFRGKTYNHSEIVKFREDPDRQTRYEAERVRWGWYAENGEALDRIFDDLVRLRTQMARKLAFDNYIGLGYKRMCRVDYGQGDVEVFRNAVREHVVPLAAELRARQARELKLDELMFWDLSLFDPRGNPAPQGDHDWMLERAQEMFDQLGGGMGEFFRTMNEGGLLDLKSREGKAGGGFCTAFPTYGTPFIFANFNGTKGDVEVFTHEVGHAFQCYQSRNLPLFDYLWPTYESCEIHSMGLEFLTWPHMDKFFGEEAERFRRTHLVQSLLFLPYGVAVDHFQHLVYASPEATPAERHGFWQEMERAYLPWVRYGDLPHVDRGGFWQFQRHIYLNPFYYIDYTLALTCALQLWVRSQRNFEEAMGAYGALCRRGGDAPFQELAASAGLVSPFEPSCLPEVVDHARKSLQL